MKVGDLVFVHKDEQWGFDSDHVALVVTKSHTKKTWHRVYGFLTQGKIVYVHHNAGLHVDIISSFDACKNNKASV
jgi:ribosomal protein L23